MFVLLINVKKFTTDLQELRLGRAGMQIIEERECREELLVVRRCVRPRSARLDQFAKLLEMFVMAQRSQKVLLVPQYEGLGMIIKMLNEGAQVLVALLVQDLILQTPLPKVLHSVASAKWVRLLPRT